MTPYSSTYGRFLSFDAFRLKSIKIKPQRQKSIKIDNTRKFVINFLSLWAGLIVISNWITSQRNIVFGI